MIGQKEELYVEKGNKKTQNKANQDRNRSSAKRKFANVKPEKRLHFLMHLGGLFNHAADHHLFEIMYSTAFSALTLLNLFH